MNCCKDHLEWLKKDIKKNGKVCQWWTNDADRRFKCDVKDCKNKAYWEVGWGEQSLQKMLGDRKRFVPLKEEI